MNQVKHSHQLHWHLAILISDNCLGSGVGGIVDSLIAANYCHIKNGGEGPIFSWTLVSKNGEAIKPFNGMDIRAQASADDFLENRIEADILVLPAICEVISSLDKARKSMESLGNFVPLIRKFHEQGKLVASACSGSFLLAQAGLMNNLPALMHWKSELNYQALFPTFPIDTKSTLADYGQIICTIGGSLAYIQLILHLVGRLAGRPLALSTAKLLMVDLGWETQVPYREALDPTNHQDKEVRQAQQWMTSNLQRNIAIAELSKKFHISDRQLNRRFKKACDQTPLQYLQSQRVQRACQLLESTSLPASKIVSLVGYQDESSFRKLFRREMSSTLENYRRHFARAKQVELENHSVVVDSSSVSH